MERNIFCHINKTLWGRGGIGGGLPQNMQKIHFELPLKSVDFSLGLTYATFTPFTSNQ